MNRMKILKINGINIKDIPLKNIKLADGKVIIKK